MSQQSKSSSTTTSAPIIVAVVSSISIISAAAIIYSYHAAANRKRRSKWMNEEDEAHGHETTHSVIDHFKSLILDPETSVEGKHVRVRSSLRLLRVFCDILCIHYILCV